MTFRLSDFVPLNDYKYLLPGYSLSMKNCASLLLLVALVLPSF
jgi:hypothetical protein